MTYHNTFKSLIEWWMGLEKKAKNSTLLFFIIGAIIVPILLASNNVANDEIKVNHIIDIIPPQPIDINPSNTEINPNKSLESAYQYLKYWFEDAEIIVDVGRNSGVKKGDYFFIIEEQKEILNLEGKQIDVRMIRKGLIEVKGVTDKTASLQLISFDLVDDSKKYIDINIGDEVEKLSQKDSEDYMIFKMNIEKYEYDAIYVTSENQKKYYLQKVKENAQNYYNYNPDSQLAPDALFKIGYASIRLEQYDDAIQNFELFLNEYPWHVSAPGARKHLMEARIHDNKSIIIN